MGKLALANSEASAANPSIAAPAAPVPTLTQAFNPEANLLIGYLSSTYGSALPQIINVKNGGSVQAGVFLGVRSTEYLCGADSSRDHGRIR